MANELKVHPSCPSWIEQTFTAAQILCGNDCARIGNALDKLPMWGGKGSVFRDNGYSVQWGEAQPAEDGWPASLSFVTVYETKPLPDGKRLLTKPVLQFYA
jgi:hypothetical protein